MKSDISNFQSTLLRKAEKNGLFRDLICPHCDFSDNKIDFRKQEINVNGLWYRCQNCNFLDVIGWDIIEESAKGRSKIKKTERKLK